MSNPARELHDLFISWIARIPSNSNQFTFSHILNSNTREHVEELQLAFRLVTACDDLIEQYAQSGFNVEMFQRHIRSWTIVIASFPARNTTIRKEDFVKGSTLDQIESLALFLEGKVHVFNDERRTQLRELISEARDLLEDDDTISVELRQYLSSLTYEIETALSNERLGKTFDFAEATRRLWVAFNASENQSTKDPGRWKRMAEAITVGTVTSLASSGVQALAGIITV